MVAVSTLLFMQIGRDESKSGTHKSATLRRASLQNSVDSSTFDGDGRRQNYDDATEIIRRHRQMPALPTAGSTMS